MFIIKFRWDENLYSLPNTPTGEIIVDDIETAIKEMARMLSSQEILIHVHCCYSPYTNIELYENNKKLVSYKYKYKKP